MKSKFLVMAAASLILASCGGGGGRPQFGDNEYPVAAVGTQSSETQTTYPATIKGVLTSIISASSMLNKKPHTLPHLAHVPYPAANTSRSSTLSVPTTPCSAAGHYYSNTCCATTTTRYNAPAKGPTCLWAAHFLPDSQGAPHNKAPQLKAEPKRASQAPCGRRMGNMPSNRHPSRMPPPTAASSR